MWLQKLWKWKERGFSDWSTCCHSQLFFIMLIIIIILCQIAWFWTRQPLLCVVFSCLSRPPYPCPLFCSDFAVLLNLLDVFPAGVRAELLSWDRLAHWAQLSQTGSLNCACFWRAGRTALLFAAGARRKSASALHRPSGSPHPCEVLYTLKCTASPLCFHSIPESPWVLSTTVSPWVLSTKLSPLWAIYTAVKSIWGLARDGAFTLCCPGINVVSSDAELSSAFKCWSEKKMCRRIHRREQKDAA